MSVDAAEKKATQASEETSAYVFPATFAQQRLWFLDRLQPGNASYLVPWALRVSGKLDAAALEATLKEIVRRHEIFRTTFALRDGSPVQIVSASATYAMPVLDLSARPDREQAAVAMAREEALRPMDLEHGPLFRSILLTLGEEDHVLLLTTHHIIFDAWSRRILVRELATLYEAFSAGRPSPLPDPRLQYADYAVWQRKFFAGKKFEQQLSYWKKQLEGIPAALQLPTDRPRPSIQTSNGKVYNFALPGELSRQLNQFGVKSGVTLYMTLLAGFQALLSRYSGQDDIAIGSPIANRNRAELEDLIGFFANTIMLRARLNGDPSFSDLLCQVKETALGAFANQEMPFERLVEELKPERSLSHNPLFQVAFSLQNVGKRDFELPGLKVAFIDRGLTTAKFDLSLFLAEAPDGIEARIEYNTDLFNASTIERMAGHYRVLLEAAIANPDLQISRLPLLTNSERTQVLERWNATDAEVPQQPVHELFEAQVRSNPAAIAIVHGKAQLTYRELSARADQLASQLQFAAVQPGDKVAILLDRSIDLVAAEIAVLKCGAAYVPIDPVFPADRKAFMITDCGARAIISSKAFIVSQLPGVPRINVEEIPPADLKPNFSPVVVTPDAIAYVMYTSGSTGQPKGVLVPHRAITRLVINNGYAKFHPTDRVAFASNPAFDATTLEVWAPLANGGRIVVLDQAEVLDPAAFGQALTKYGITVLWMTVGLFNEYADLLSEKFRKLRYLMTGGDALDPKVISRVLRHGAPQHLLNGYGPTETTTFAATHEILEVAEGARSIPIGRPIGNTRIYILDGHRQPVPIGVTGELYIAGAGVAQGYLERPGLTAERFVTDPFSGKPNARMYKTGDLGRWLDDGTIEFQGRNDFQVKLRGFRIELGEIESVIKKHLSVQDCVVIVREDAVRDKRLVAYVIAKPNQSLDVSDLRMQIKASLPDYMVPAAFVKVDKFPLNANGKIDRSALPRPDFTATLPAELVAPRDEVEAQLLKIWQELLNNDHISVTDNFFDLGGHSLAAVRLISEIRNRLGTEIPLTAFFQGATVEYLATLVKGQDTVDRSMVREIQRGNGSLPIFFAAVLPGVNALGYLNLSKHMGAEHPFYMLQGAGPVPGAVRKPYTQQEYEQLASDYIRAMQTVQPEGPYHLGGMCEGARIAFEMTRLLESQGHTVTLLAVMDTWVVENTQNPLLWKIDYYLGRLHMFLREPLRKKAALARRAAQNRLMRWTKSQPTRSEWLETYWPGRDFVPSRVRSRITVFKVPKQPFYYHSDKFLGWGSRTESGVEIDVIPNGRHRLLLREPYVRELGAALSKRLKQDQEPHSTTATVERDSAETAISR